jgi:hypothetical protein
VTDFCYTRPMMQRVLQQAELMDRMMHCIGVEPVERHASRRGWLGTKRAPGALRASMTNDAATG